jgi:SAM-dependent methyltransferase
MNLGLPEEAPCSWSEEKLYLRYAIPKIWTQKASRPFGIYWSNKLSFGRLWPEPTDDELHSFYDISTYSEYLAGAKEKGNSTKPSLLSRTIVKLAWLSDRGPGDAASTILSLKQDARTICDIGCGSGVFLAEIRRRGIAPTGVDPSPISAGAVRARSIDFHSGTAESLPIELTGKQFDVVSMFQSLEHCRAPARAVQNALSLLDQRGLLVIDVPNMGCIGFEKYGAAWWHTDAGRHLQFFTMASLEALLKKCGATVIKWEFKGFVTQFIQSWIDDMAVVWDAIGPTDSPRPSLRKSLSYMPRALFSEDERKYEIVRVYALRS